ncbi:MAG: SRPBCC family protein [Polyangiaceae bacterium]
MTRVATLHTTLVFEREIPAPVEEVFAAFADPVARAAWGAPSDTAVVIYDEADFREGGQDRFRCGSKTNPNIHGMTRYLEIVANRRVVSSETIVVDGNRLCASLTTLELVPDGAETKLKSTTQLASFIGAEMVKGYETGNNASLDNLVRYVRAKRK